MTAPAFNVGDRVLISCVDDYKESRVRLVFQDAEGTVTAITLAGFYAVRIEALDLEWVFEPQDLKAAP